MPLSSQLYFLAVDCFILCFLIRNDHLRQVGYFIQGQGSGDSKKYDWIMLEENKRMTKGHLKKLTFSLSFSLLQTAPGGPLVVFLPLLPWAGAKYK